MNDHANEFTIDASKKIAAVYHNYYQEGVVRLPIKPDGYYKEFDVNFRGSDGIRDGERFVRGIDQKVYFTTDHYQTFVEIQE